MYTYNVLICRPTVVAAADGGGDTADDGECVGRCVNVASLTSNDWTHISQCRLSFQLI